MAASKTKTPDDQPFEGSLSAFAKEAQGEVTPYRLDIGGGKRVTFRRPEDLGFNDFMTLYGKVDADNMTNVEQVQFFLDASLDEADHKALLDANPPLVVMQKVIEDVNRHYGVEVPNLGESPASSD